MVDLLTFWYQSCTELSELYNEIASSTTTVATRARGERHCASIRTFLRACILMPVDANGNEQHAADLASKCERRDGNDSDKDQRHPLPIHTRHGDRLSLQPERLVNVAQRLGHVAIVTQCRRPRLGRRS